MFQSMVFDIDVKGVPSGTQSLAFQMDAASSGSEKTPVDNSFILQLPLITKANLSLDG
jgi:hypothetical protein